MRAGNMGKKKELIAEWSQVHPNADDDWEADMGMFTMDAREGLAVNSADVGEAYQR